MGIFLSENRDHYSWVACKASSSSLVSTDALVEWILCFSAGKCWCLEWKAAPKQLRAVPCTCPAGKCSPKLHFKVTSCLHGWGLWSDEVQSSLGSGFTEPLLPFPPALWSSGDLLVGGFEKWNSTGGGIAAGSSFVIISWYKENSAQGKQCSRKTLEINK